MLDKDTMDKLSVFIDNYIATQKWIIPKKSTLKKHHIALLMKAFASLGFCKKTKAYEIAYGRPPTNYSQCLNIFEQPYVIYLEQAAYKEYAKMRTSDFTFEDAVVTLKEMLAGNPTAFTTVEEGKVRTLDTHEVAPEQLKAVKKIVPGKNGQPIIELYDRQEALKLLAFFEEKIRERDNRAQGLLAPPSVTITFNADGVAEVSKGTI